MCSCSDFEIAMEQALEDVTIADFTQMMQGPWATMQLADMGADVIKIEPPGGELERDLPVAGEMYGEESILYLAMNRNKRSVVVDLKDEEGKQIVRDIVAEADVLVENFRPGVMESLGFGYEDVREYNPDIVYASASGYGETGPYRDRPGQDLLIQGLSGLAKHTGQQTEPPTAAGTFVADELSALLIAMHIVIALYYREQTGEGQKIEANLLDSMVAGMCQEVAAELNMDFDIERPGENLSHATFGAPYGIYETADGHVAISLGELGQFSEVLGIDDLETDDTSKEQYERRDEIFRAIESHTREYPTDELLDQLLAEDIWAGRINDFAEMAEDPQIQHNDMIIEVDHPEAGTFETTGFPVSMSKTPGEVRNPPPRAGEHTTEVLRDFGYEAAEISEFVEQGAVERMDD